MLSFLDASIYDFRKMLSRRWRWTTGLHYYNFACIETHEIMDTAGIEEMVSFCGHRNDSMLYTICAHTYVLVYDVHALFYHIT